MALIGASTSALVVVTLNGPDGQLHVDAMSRTIQGILTGLGFLGAGVIVRGPDESHVHGLTTAATVWTTAILGTLCGTGAWVVAITLVVVTGLVLVFGGSLERFAHRNLDRHNSDDSHGP
jgi:putative Mg2+ transporter-C (MgtC) family protein